MNRVVALLLIPIFMLGQAWPHSHAGMTGIDSDEHASRPHIHFSTSSHHEDDHHHSSDNHGHAAGAHQHCDGTQYETHCGHQVADTHRNVAPLIDHDSDAVYFAAGTSITPRNLSLPEVEQAADLCWSNPTSVESARWRSATEDPPERYVWSPIYLLTLSLRL
jgi:hypothetical protein